MFTRRSFLFLVMLALTNRYATRVSATESTTEQPPVPIRPSSSGESFLGERSVTSLARDLSLRPFRQRRSVPDDWLNLTYDEYRTLWFNERRALWTNTERPFRVDLFHPGLYFPRPIHISVVENNKAYPLPFDLSVFDRTDKSPPLTIDDSLGYSGFRLRGELEHPGIHQEFCVFQGASYFRAIATGQIYGLSARGLALGTGTKDEEFPDFTHFWIESPPPASSADEIIVHALLDSPSVTGAYRFVVRYGVPMIMDVRCHLFPRAPLDHVGIAPLTSMFLFDETNRGRFDDFRPAVHDNDGLLIRNGAGETLWRPLSNPNRLQSSFFVDEHPRGFGLMQRARDFRDFADLEAHYHRRPGLWVEPSGDWGRGSVQLVEIPSDREIYDNIGAFWRPRESLVSGEEYTYSYRLFWGEEPPAASPPDTSLVTSSVARVINTRLGKRFGGGYIVTIDFESSGFFSGSLDDIFIHISSPHADVSPGILQRNPSTGGIRLGFRFDPSDRSFAELRAQLRMNDRNISEVWLYRWTS